MSRCPDLLHAPRSALDRDWNGVQKVLVVSMHPLNLDLPPSIIGVFEPSKEHEINIIK
jgi:hypothetical protein